MSKISPKKVALWTGIAAIGGYLAGILTAPNSGKETRQGIKDTADKGINEGEKQLKQAVTELSELIDDAKSGSENLRGKAHTEFEEIVTKAKVTREKAREILSAIHEGETQNKDLQIAVRDANLALKHLRSYLKQ